MNPLHIDLDNYRSFEHLSLDLPTGCIAVLGENGAGKSSIVNAIDLALFGPPSRNLGDYLSEDAFDADLTLCLEFEHRGETYRVRRTYSGKGRGKTSLDFEQQLVHEAEPVYIWEPLTRETAAATQELICETLGLSRETFRASAFLAQGDGAAFTEAQPRERKAILAEVLGLDIWDRLLEIAKTDRRRLEDTGHRLTTELARSRDELATRPSLEARRSELGESAQALQDGLAQLEARKTEAQNALAAAREKAAELKGAREVLETREAELQRVEKRVEEIRDEERSAEALGRERDAEQGLADRIPDLEAELEQAHAAAEARRTRDQAAAQLHEAEQTAAGLVEQAEAVRKLAAAKEGEEDARCQTCEQPIHGEAKARAIAELIERAEQLEVKVAELDTVREERSRLVRDGDQLLSKVTAREPREVDDRLRRARDAATRVASIAARLERLDELKAERELHERSLPEFRTAAAEQRTKVEGEPLPDEGQLVRVVSIVESQIITARPALDRTRQELAVAEAELERLEKLHTRASFLAVEQRDLQSELDVVLLAERAYGRDGIPALILENAAIPQIEVEANRILAELGTSFSVELHTQRELKGGGVAEALDIVVAGETGGTRPYETFSGGERTRLNLALRIALARLLAHRRGAEVRLLVIDEPEFLDEAGVARLAEVLRGLSSDFIRIFLISHQPALREAFDEVLTVVKDGERSRVEEAAEPVEALA